MKKKLIRKVCAVIFGMMIMTFISCKQNADEGGSSSSSSPSNGFEKDRYEIIAGNTAEIDVDADGEVNFEVSNSKVCEIVSSRGNTVRLLGKKEGATVLKAECKDKVYKTVIKVTE